MKNLFYGTIILILLYIAYAYLYDHPTKTSNHTQFISEFKERPKIVTGFKEIFDTIHLCNKKFLIGESCINVIAKRTANYTYKLDSKIKYDSDYNTMKYSTLSIDIVLDTMYIQPVVINKYVDIPNVTQEDIKFLNDTSLVMYLSNEPRTKEVLEKYVVTKINDP